MKLLLDTHVLIWALSSPDQLSAKHRAAITDPTDAVYVSAMSIAEIAIKSSIGKLTVDPDLEQNSYLGMIQAVEQMGFEDLPFTARDGGQLRALPLHHRDPFDRMLIAQAMNIGATVVTVDPAFGLYDVKVL